jgi:hypothetical protein
MTRLETALSKVAFPSVEQLGLVHITIADALRDILDTEALVPSYCETFNKRLLYFSYGLPYYRPGNRRTEDFLQHPVALAFNPTLLAQVERFYPYDTGAANRGLFGTKWTPFLKRFEDLYVTEAPERLVASLYGSNHNYLKGEVPRHGGSMPQPLATLLRFLASNLSGSGVDQRQRTIEGLTGDSIAVLNSLEWVAYPETAADLVRQLWRACDPKFRYQEYQPDVNDNPAELVVLIRAHARRAFGHLSEPPHGTT